MINLIQLEMFKLFNRGLAYIGFVAIFLIVLVIQVGMYVEGQRLLDFLIQSLSEVFLLQGKLINVYTVTYIILNSLWIHIPILVAIVAGDMVSGEAGRGTFRLLLTRPVGRAKLLAAKFITAQVYATLLVVLLMVMSLGIGRLFFEHGDMIVLMNTINIFDQSDVLWRFMAAFGYGIVSMWGIAALSFLFLVRATNSLGPVISAMSVVILFTIISNFSVGVFEPVKPFLFTSYLNGWQLFFDDPIDFVLIYKSLAVLVAHITAFYLLSVFIFVRKDITS